MTVEIIIVLRYIVGVVLEFTENCHIFVTRNG